MNQQAETSQALALLLDAEASARGLSRADLLQRLARSQQFNPRRASYYALLLRAMEPAGPRAFGPPPAVRRIVERVRAAGLEPRVPAGPVLLVCESMPFAPDLDNPVEQILLRLLGSLKSLGVQAWILRLGRRSRRLCNQLMNNLPGKPAGILSVEVSHPGCLELLGKLGPLVQVGMKSVLMRRLPCIEHDTALEAAEITDRAADLRADQIAFVGLIRRVAGKRRIRAGDARLLSMLAMEAQNHHITLPGNLQLWADAGQSLEQAGLLAKLSQQNLSRTLLVVAGREHAAEAAGALKDKGYAGLICRHWMADSADSWPTVGQDLDRLTSASLLRLLQPEAIPTDLALLVPPKWLHGVRPI